MVRLVLPTQAEPGRSLDGAVTKGRRRREGRKETASDKVGEGVVEVNWAKLLDGSRVLELLYRLEVKREMLGLVHFSQCIGDRRLSTTGVGIVKSPVGFPS